jgi:L-cysteine/cystine lyase
MPALSNKTYFNYGGQGPLPTPSLEAITACWRMIQEHGPFTTAVWPLLEQVSGKLRQRLSHWLGVPPHRLALTENVTSGCVLPLWGLPWQRGDELLIGDCEHPGVVAACRELARREGLTIATLPVLASCQQRPQAELGAAVLQQLEQAVTPRTRLVVLSHLLWNSGAVMPIQAVAEQLQHHPRQPWLLVDAAQSLGSIPVADAARHADIYGCTGHKWCCGPEGLGVVALSERLLEQAQPTLIGWRSLSHEHEAGSGFHRDGRRFEVATSCLPLAAGLDCSLQLLEAEGSSQERLARIRQGAADLWQGLQQLPGVETLLPEAPPAGLVSFRYQAGQHPTADLDAIVRQLGDQGIWIRSLDGPACLRACIHITTEVAEVKQLLTALATR